MIKKRKVWVIALIFNLFIFLSLAYAYLPSEQILDENNPIEQYRNNFPEIDEGAISLDKTLPSDIPNSLVLWDDEGFPTKIVFKDYQVKEKLGTSIASRSDVLIASQNFLNNHKDILGVDITQLRVKGVYYPSISSSAIPSASPTSSPSPSISPSIISENYPSQRIANVVYEQIVENPADGKDYPVAGSFVVLGFTKGIDNVWRLVLYKTNVVRDSFIQEPVLSREEAIAYASGYMQSVDIVYAIANTEKIELVGYPVNDEKSIVLAYRITFEEVNNLEIEKLAVIIDARFGQLLNFYDTLQRVQVSGKVSGIIYPETPTKGQLDNIGFKNNYIWVKDSSGEKRAETIEDGTYSLDVTNPLIIRSQLEGSWANVKDDATTAQRIAISKPVSEDTNINWKDHDISYKQEQSNVFYHTNIVHDYAVQPHISAEMNFQMPVYVNIQNQCNAYYNPGDLSINFYAKGERCEATSLFSDIIYHEYAHGITDSIITLDEDAFPYRDETGNLNEAHSDYVACSVSDIQGSHDPACMDAIQIGNENACFRRCDTDDKYPDNYDPEPHSGMQIISGALWDMREKLIVKLGKDEGIKKADSLATGALRFQPTSFITYIEGMLVVDDDNGNLDDGTPLITEICDSFIDHGVVSPLCKGFSSKPLALILSPSYDSIIDESINPFSVIGIAAPSKDRELKEWVLELGAYDRNTKEFKILKEVTRSAFPSEGVLNEFDVSELELGKLYALRLKVIEIGGNENNYQVIFIRSHPLIIRITDDKQGGSLGGLVGFGIRGKDTSIKFLQKDAFCEENPCDIRVFIHSKNDGDIIIWNNFIYNQFTDGFRDTSYYVFYKKYNYPTFLIELHTKDTSEIQINIRQLFVDKDIPIKYIEIFADYVGSLYSIIIGNGYLKKSLFVFKDDNLFFTDYYFAIHYSGYNKETHKIMGISLPVVYPFSETAYIDPLSLHENVISVHDTLNSENYISSRLYKKQRNFDSWNPPFLTTIYLLSSDEKINFFLNQPNFDKTNNVMEAYMFASDQSNWFNIQKLYYGEKLLQKSDIELFKDPFKLDIIDKSNYFISIGVLIFVLQDSFDDELYWRAISLAKPTVTLPNGNQVLISSVLIRYFDIPGAFICVRCEKGIYKFDWIVGDKNNDGIGDVFKDGSILKLHKEFYFDGEKFIFHSDNDFLRGDANSDGFIDISDAVFILDYLFQGNVQPSCMDALDVDDNGVVEITDAVYFLTFLFLDGDKPPEPYPDKGADPTSDNLLCQS
ncbi:hypothetical protein HYV49_00340 [Candidatus Pacearchaeota archaeon]|nr:hypothetical protein [Candidatus Pacearchaeota archaeon]